MEGRIIEEVSIVEFITFIEKKNKRFQATILQAIEDSFSQDVMNYRRENPTVTKDEFIKFKLKNQEKFKEIRKLVLDWSNDYTRSIYKAIFGTDFEGNLR